MLINNDDDDDDDVVGVQHLKLLFARDIVQVAVLGLM